MHEKYLKLKGILREHNYPMIYPFKFIIKKDTAKMIEIKRVFDETAEIVVKDSSKGNYSAITIKQMMLNAEDIINRYEALEKVEGVISL